MDCRDCKDWRTCLGKTVICPRCHNDEARKRNCFECGGTGYVKEGYLFAELRFCPYQVCWILTNEEILDMGRWPDTYSIYERPQKSQVAREGYFVKPKLIIAEVRARLDSCKPAEAQSLIFQCKANVELPNLTEEAWQVLMYVKGKSRKKMTFSEWRYWQNKMRKSSKKLELNEATV